jgi:hypothetical protein
MGTSSQPASQGQPGAKRKQDKKGRQSKSGKRSQPATLLESAVNLLNPVPQMKEELINWTMDV